VPAPVLLDATPLAGGHGARGIGAAVRGMLDGLATVPPADRPRLLVRAGQAPPPGFDAVAVRWPRWPLHRVPDPWPAARGERVARRAAGAGAFHATQPSLVPRGRTVVTCFDLIPAAFAPEYLAGAGRAGQRAAFARFLARLRAATLVLVPSRETAGDVVRLAGVDPGRVREVPLGVPPAAVPEGDVPDGPYVLYSGAVEPHKNAAVALEAIAAAEPGVRLVMAGPWSARRAARLRGHAARVGADGRVDWLGYVPPGRLAALRAGAAAVLVPSRKEGFGFPVLEAMAAGVPVLASATPALREVGGDAAAAYLPPADAGAWGREISRLAGAPAAERVRLADAGRRRAGEFTWARTAEGIVAAHREVAP
jgi:glycosyltransferase involved in cell wall biosynthesis